MSKNVVYKNVYGPFTITPHRLLLYLVHLGYTPVRNILKPRNSVSNKKYNLSRRLKNVHGCYIPGPVTSKAIRVTQSKEPTEKELENKYIWPSTFVLMYHIRDKKLWADNCLEIGPGVYPVIRLKTTTNGHATFVGQNDALPVHSYEHHLNMEYSEALPQLPYEKINLIVGADPFDDMAGVIGTAQIIRRTLAPDGMAFIATSIPQYAMRLRKLLEESHMDVGIDTFEYTYFDKMITILQIKRY